MTSTPGFEVSASMCNSVVLYCNNYFSRIYRPSFSKNLKTRRKPDFEINPRFGTHHAVLSNIKLNINRTPDGVRDLQGYQESSMKTRTVYHSDGRIEMRRVITPQTLKDWDRNLPLAYERSILWLKPIDGLAFVRVSVVRNARSRRGPLLTGNAKQVVLGYSKLTTDAPLMPGNDMCYFRRVFYLTQQDILLSDFSELNENCLRPCSILPTVWGEKFTLSEEDSCNGTIEALVG
jgi:hypothetical protein